MHGETLTVHADTLLETLTVREMLMYTAELKLELGVSAAEKRARVDALLGQLALEACQHVRIGGAMQRGISGVLQGEIAVLLISWG
jgi:ABC-type multidrug transport system ATPase subunit